VQVDHLDGLFILLAWQHPETTANVVVEQAPNTVLEPCTAPIPVVFLKVLDILMAL
jgi:hypothetical protein